MNFDRLNDLGVKTSVSDFEPQTAWPAWWVFKIVNLTRSKLLLCIFHHSLGRRQIGSIFRNQANIHLYPFPPIPEPKGSFNVAGRDSKTGTGPWRPAFGLSRLREIVQLGKKSKFWARSLEIDPD
jgi:hypothetical protein